MKMLFSLFLLLLCACPLAAQVNGEPAYSVPDINGRATFLSKPVVADPKFDGRTVTVKLIVETDGTVLSAACSRSCPSELKDVVESAARSSSFSPLLVKGRLVRYEGILMYTFAISRINWFRFATALGSTHIFDNISLGPVAEMLPDDWAEERTRLHEIDKLNDVNSRIRSIEASVARFQQKLNGHELWEFELGLAVRRLTAPFQSDRGVIREEIQADLRGLKRFVDAAPAGVRDVTLTALRSLSVYEVRSDAKNEELARDIFQLVGSMKFGSR